MMKFDNTKIKKDNRWPCGCQDPEGTRVNHSDACIKRWRKERDLRKQNERTANGRRYYRKTKRADPYSIRVGFCATLLDDEQARARRYAIDYKSPGIQESLEFYI